MTDILIDLEDGLPPARIERVGKPAPQPKAGIRVKAPEAIEITSVPVGIAISYAPIRCVSCGSHHKDHRGIFLESRLSNGVRQLRRITMRELAAFTALPRKIDVGPEEVIPVCENCWMREDSFLDAVAVAAAQPELFGEVGQSEPLSRIIQKLDRADEKVPPEQEPEGGDAPLSGNINIEEEL